MIIKSDVCHLPASLQEQFSAGVARGHPLWRIVQNGLQDEHLADRIEIYSCTRLNFGTNRRFRLTLDDTDPIAVKISELAQHHRLTKSRVFDILVKIGWDQFQTRITKIGAISAEIHPQTKPTGTQAVGAPTTTSPTSPLVEPVLLQTADVPFAESPEFSRITRNMLASFGIEF